MKLENFYIKSIERCTNCMDNIKPLGLYLTKTNKTAIKYKFTKKLSNLNI